MKMHNPTLLPVFGGVAVNFNSFRVALEASGIGIGIVVSSKFAFDISARHTSKNTHFVRSVIDRAIMLLALGVRCLSQIAVAPCTQSTSLRTESSQNQRVMQNGQATEHSVGRAITMSTEWTQS